MRGLLFTVLTSAVLPLGTTLAQTQAEQPPSPQTQQPATPPQAQQGGQQPIAQQCLNDLAAFGERVTEEGYWLTGWRHGMPTAGPMAPTPDAPVPMTPGTAAEAPTTAPSPGLDPWGAVAWQQAPGYELRALYTAAKVLARRGDEQVCQTVLSELNQVYDQYAGELRQAGVEPGEVTSWRAQQLASAQPVSQYEAALRLDNIAGTDLRNQADQYLGSVEDIVLDPQDRSIAYVVVERGDFLGIGGSSVAVPWQELRVTPGMNTFVLNVPEEAMNDAPAIDPSTFADPARFQERRQEIDQYWQQHRTG